MARIKFVRSLDVNSSEYQATERDYIGLVRGLVGKSRSEQEEQWDRIEDFLGRLVSERGWNRKGIYELTGNVLTRAYNDPAAADHIALPPEVIDQLDNYETGLNGDCAAQSIRRFAGEPEDLEELANYVRSGRWLD